MRKNWFIALMGATLLALVPATALAHGHHARHHAKRQHQVRSHLRHFTAANSSSPATAGTTGTTGSDNAGKVTSFDGSKLVITLNDGSTVSGTVNGDSQLSCESASSPSSTDTTDTTDTTDSSTMQSDLSGDGGGDQSVGSTQSSSDDQGSSAGQDDQGVQNDQGDQGNDNGANGQAACTSANLIPDTVVHGAELSVSSTSSVWRQVDLVLP